MFYPRILYAVVFKITTGVIKLMMKLANVDK